jgi:hypothetical protein
MNFSNFKLGIYDLLGLVIPGMILICEGAITLRGWVNFRTSLNHMSGTSFTFLLVVSFVLGHLVQELADVSIKKIKGPRFFAAGRDEFWADPEAEAIKSAVWAESGVILGSVDALFDLFDSARRAIHEARNTAGNGRPLPILSRAGGLRKQGIRDSKSLMFTNLFSG